MKASDGRLSPFQPLADDDGLDVLFFDKVTGNSVAIQLKCRTVSIRKRNSEERGNVEEPLWRAMLGLVKHTVEGEALAHQCRKRDTDDGARPVKRLSNAKREQLGMAPDEHI